MWPKLSADTDTDTDTVGTAGAWMRRSGIEACGRAVVELQDAAAWKPELRSRSLLRGAPVRHLADPALAAAALNANPARLLRDLNWMGFLFESLVVRDLRVYAQALGGEVFHYRDNTGLEADAVTRRDGVFQIPVGTLAA